MYGQKSLLRSMRIKELEMTGYNLICDTALRICKNESLEQSVFGRVCRLKRGGDETLKIVLIYVKICIR